MAEPLLSIESLKVSFETADGTVEAVNGLDLKIEPGDRVAVVGESGSGKSQAFLASLGLLARNGTATGRVAWGEHNLLELSQEQLNHYRGKHIGMVFQDPMTALTPHLKIGRQLSEVLEVHYGMTAEEAGRKVIALLEKVRIPDAPKRFSQYPHELSGGMRQRVMIAMALLCEPELLIADEPTTALDVTIQAEILSLFQDLVTEQQMALILITHDLGVVAGLCEQAAVMYAGNIVERGRVADLFRNPGHPYTAGLIDSTPRLDQDYGEPMTAIPGQPPNLQRLPPGCPFRQRCRYEVSDCEKLPVLDQYASGRWAACFRAGDFGYQQDSAR